MGSRSKQTPITTWLNIFVFCIRSPSNEATKEAYIFARLISKISQKSEQVLYTLGWPAYSKAIYCKRGWVEWGRMPVLFFPFLLLYLRKKKEKKKLPIWDHGFIKVGTFFCVDLLWFFGVEVFFFYFIFFYDIIILFAPGGTSIGWVVIRFRRCSCLRKWSRVSSKYLYWPGQFTRPIIKADKNKAPFSR